MSSTGVLWRPLSQRVSHPGMSGTSHGQQSPANGSKNSARNTGTQLPATEAILNKYCLSKTKCKLEESIHALDLFFIIVQPSCECLCYCAACSKCLSCIGSRY